MLDPVQEARICRTHSRRQTRLVCAFSFHAPCLPIHCCLLTSTVVVCQLLIQKDKELKALRLANKQMKTAAAGRDKEIAELNALVTKLSPKKKPRTK